MLLFLMFAGVINVDLNVSLGAPLVVDELLSNYIS